MKKKTILIITSAAALLLLLVFAIPATSGNAPEDEIKSYVVTVDMRQDGSMDIKYHLEWTVLDDTKNGALTWVQIGVPNSHADEIRRISDNIAAVSNLSGDGSMVRVDFDRAYFAGDTVSFDFSIHQPYMHDVNKKAGTCTYVFTPGWFDDIEVKSLKILWNRANVSESNATGMEGEYLVWETALKAGKKYTVKVVYPMDVFDLPAEKQIPYEGIIFLVLCAFAIIGVIVDRLRGHYRGGFGGGRGHWHHTHRSCACAGCACACACACAGGGRAGCSIKDFYGAGVALHTLKDRLTNENQK